MPRDYKNNSYRHSKPLKKPGLDDWDRVLLIIFVVILAITVKYVLIAEQQKQPIPPIPLTMPVNADKKVASATATAVQAAKEVIAAGGLSEEELSLEPPPEAMVKATSNPLTTEAKPQLFEKTNTMPSLNTLNAKPNKQDSESAEPHFDFYNILPSVEVVVPDYEIKTRLREEKIGEPTHHNQYTMQAGSFQQQNDAMNLIEKLKNIGVEARIETAQVGETIWYRVKLGPYNDMTQVMNLKSQLRIQGINPLVTELK